MNNIYQHYIIDLSSNNNFVQIPAVQGDGNNIRGFEVELIENSVQYEIDKNDCVIAIMGTKPDTSQIMNDCKLTDEGYIQVDITSQMSAVKGRGDYQIVLMSKSTNSQLKSFPFHILTTPATFDVDHIISSDEFQLLTKGTVEANKAIKELNDNIDILNNYVDQAKESKEVAMQKAAEAANSANSAEGSADKSKQEADKSSASATVSANSANIAIQKANEATDSATEAKASETNAKDSENAAKVSETAAKISETNAKVSENAAKLSEDAAKKSEENTSEYATNAAASAATATQKASAAATSEANAAESAENASDSALAATDGANTATEKATISVASADTATTKATEANNYAILSKSYAVGGTGTRENENTDSAKYYYEQAQNISQGLNGLIPMGTITFDELENEDNQKPGYFFNICDSFVSDERFKDGSGVFYGAGNNVLRTADGMWDVTAASMLSGVKGSNETEFRQGFVNLTAENVGALPSDGIAQNSEKWSGKTMIIISEDEYQALEEKNENTVYFRYKEQ